jgi:hypothetical protein
MKEASCGSAIWLNVENPAASAEFFKRYFGFAEAMAADGFVSPSRKDANFNVIFLRTGWQPSSLKSFEGHADGLLIVFVVDDIDGE